MQIADLALPHLADFSTSQLKDLFFAFTKSPEGIPRTKNALLEKLTPSLPDRELQDLISRLEARQPFRHLFLLSFNERLRKGDLVERAQRYLAKQNSEGSPALLGMRVLDVHAPSNDDCVLIRMVHTIANYDLRPVSADTMKRVRLEVRHPVVIAVKPDLGLVEVRFNGFDQTKYTPQEEKIPYPHIAEACAEIATDVLGFELASVQLASAVVSLVAKYPTEVLEKRIVSRAGKGRVSIQADEAAGIDDVADVLRTALDISDAGVELQKAMSSWTKEHVTLAWEKYGVLTRLDLTLPIPEIMFLWRSPSGKDWQIVDAVVRALVSEAPVRSTNAQAAAAIAWAAVGTCDVVAPFELAQRANIAMDDALGYLVQLVSMKSAAMRFRVRTPLMLMDRQNDWKESLKVFPHEVLLEDRSSLDLTDLKNIEVGFTRIGRSA